MPRAWKRWLLAGFLLGCASAGEVHDTHVHWSLRLSSSSWEPLLGRFAFNITTRSPSAQQLFQIGLLLLYNFDQPNARSAFQAALQADESCAMCAWGVAHSCGPFLNRPTKGVDELALGLAAAQNATALLALRRGEHSPKEQALIEAMAVRYPSEPQTGDQLLSYKQYRSLLHSLRKASASLSTDADMMVFEAEAIMVLMTDSSGYHFYASRGDELPPVEMPGTKEASDLLRAALLITNQTHPYAQHLLIHSTEMSTAEAETAVMVASQLLKNMAGLQDQHLQHMTSHTFLRTGHYHEAIEGNIAAVQSDSAYLRHGLVPYGPGHNSVFLVCSALWGGERAAAYKYADVAQNIFRNAPSRRDGPGPDQAWAYPMIVAVRFGDWGKMQALDAAPPGNFSGQWPYGYGVLRHFSLAVASTHLGRAKDAETHAQSLRALMPAVALSRNDLLVNLTSIANHSVTGVLASAQGDLELAVHALKQAVDAELSMPYDEPPPWLLPTRECYGQALLNAGRPADAERTFRAALYGFSFHAEPLCGWALLGLIASLKEQAPTENRTREIAELTLAKDKAWLHADVPLKSPCVHLVSKERLPHFV